MTSSFREDLSDLTLNNNYLLDLQNRKTNEKVLIIKYSSPVTTSNTRFISTISTNPIEYKNSLNYNANQYGTNIDLKILTYLYFSDNEKNYQFRVTNGKSSYLGDFSMYLNNYQYKIFDNTSTNKISNIDIIKKGVYLLCLEIPYYNSNFKIQYTNNSKTWLDLDKLLISNFTTTLDKKTLIDTFLISGLNYCNKDNINSTACNDFYKNIEDTTVANYLDEIQTSIYPSPVNGSYTNFSTWNINDTNFQNIENINPLPTDRTNFQCGINTKRTRTRTYNSSKYGGNPNFEDEIYKIESKKPNMSLEKNSQGTYLTQEEKKDITCYTPDEINNQWKNNGCLTLSPPNNDILKYLPYNVDFTNIKTNIDKWSYNKLLNTNDTSLIKQCYGNDGYFVVKSDRSNTKLYPGTEINNENGTKDIQVLVNGNFKIIFQKDGNLVLYNGTVESKNAKWSSRTYNKNGTKLRMQYDGNLVIYTNNDTSLWSSDTNNMDKNITSAELTNFGFLVINNQNNDILKIFPDFKIVDEHIKTVHWNNSPWALFADKAGYIWKAGWSDLNKELDGQPSIDYFPVSNNNEQCSASPKYDYCPFRGLRKDVSNTEWKVNALNLRDINGYNVELDNKIQPDADNNNGDRNYNTYNDLKNFENDKYSNRKPPQLTSGIEKPNYIPGYNRISSTWGKSNNDDTRWFLVSKRGGSSKDQSFVIFYKLKNKDSYTQDILKNHPDLIKNIFLDSNLTKLIKKYIGLDKDWANPYKNKLLKDYNISPFTNKNNFTNKLKVSLLENYENPKCNLENILTDSNCNSLEVNIYKDYINNMNKYCTDNWVNSLNTECVDYYNKSFIDSNNQSIKIDVEGKLKLLEIQEKACNNDNYFLNDRCIELNYSKPDIIKYQAKLCSDGKNKELCDELTKKYTNQVKKNISVNMLNDDQEVLYKNNLEKDILYLKCNENNNNVLLNNCNRLINDPNLSEEEKNNLINRKNELCTKTNINHPECIKYNKENPNILNKLKNICLQNKSDDCKAFCKNNKDDEEFKKTDFYKEVCYSWIEEFWWIILLIVLAILGGGFVYLNKKKTININTNSNTNSITNSNLISS